MKSYLDPIYLAITEQAWQNRVYAVIFASLNDYLNCLEKIEKNSNTLYKLIRFKFSEDLFSEIYNHNPFRNEPKVQNFYQNLFIKTLEELTRRFDWCPSNCIIDEQASNEFTCENENIPPIVLEAWTILLNQCAACNLQDSFVVLSPDSCKTDLQFNSIIFLQTNSIYQLLSVTLFLEKERLNENTLRQAIKIYYQQAVIQSRIESDQNPQDYIFDHNFWQTIEKAKLTEEDQEYKLKFIDSLTQVVYDKDIDIRRHKYGKISINNKKYDQYSADVFKMGRGTNDNRCSRIFYCKIQNQICFYSFDPDFHKGE